VSGLGRRLVRLEGAARSPRAARSPELLVISPDDWPEHDRAAYDAAGVAGDRRTRRLLLAKHTGHEPDPATTIIAIRVRPDGPQ
jgi:hypothetical protein